MKEEDKKNKSIEDEEEDDTEDDVSEIDFKILKKVLFHH